ncbi:coiled-coil domain-containing protein 40-like [Eucyclogobius newberryi]|uniref:coiled-coil domain-containing protein 40-like n=1 Tax=Eucyclogobius newberryi TaxID=166745 RepID=UPI003B5C7D44
MTHLQNETAELWVTQGDHQTEHDPEGLEEHPEPGEPTDQEPSGRWQAAAENYALGDPVPVSPDLSEIMHDPRQTVNSYVDDNEENEFVLDPDHELLKMNQAALNALYNKQLERINSELKAKLALAKAEESEIEAASTEIYRIDQNRLRLQNKLDVLHQSKVEAEKKHLQTIEQLEANRSQFSSSTNQHKHKNAIASQLQSEFDSLMRDLTYTQEVSDKLQASIKAMKNATHKVEAEKFQAEEQKLKQDLYVERLEKEKERLTEQVALYNAQTLTQADETRATKEALSEAEMEKMSLLMAHKQILQQWKNSLIRMRREEEQFTVMQEAKQKCEHQLISLDREIKGYEKTIKDEQNQNESLTMELDRAQKNNSTTKAQINQKQAQQEAMLNHYSTCLRTLQEKERTLAQLTKETANLEASVNAQQKQMTKERALHLELEDHIVNAMQQSLIHNKATKFLQKNLEKLTVLKKKRTSELWQLENSILECELESSESYQNLSKLEFTQNTLDDETEKMDKRLQDQKVSQSACIFLIGQYQSTITKIKKRINLIVAATGNEDLSPLQIKIDAMKMQIEELEGNKNRDHHLCIERQSTFMGLTQELENTNKSILQLQTEYTCLQQERIRLENLIEGEHRDEQDLQKNTEALRRDLTRLNTRLTKNVKLSQTLEQDNALMQTDFTKKLQEEELESFKMEMKWEKKAEEKERIFKCLVEAERQIMLWEKKIQIVKEMYSMVQNEEEQAEVQMMKADVHLKELQLTQLMKEQGRLVRESEATVARLDTIVSRQESLRHSSPNRQRKKGELQLLIQSHQRKITTTHKQGMECEWVIGELQQRKVSANSQLSQQKQQIIDLCKESFELEQDSAELQDTKDKNLYRLVAIQNWSKKLRSVKSNSYKPVSNSESIVMALQKQMERVHVTSTILHQTCQDFPQHKGALRKLTLALEAQSQENVQS